MIYEIYFDRASRTWWAFYKDECGDQIGEAVHAHNRDDCLILLGKAHDDRRMLYNERLLERRVKDQ